MCTLPAFRAVAVVALAATSLSAQTVGARLSVEEYEPGSSLKVPGHRVARARFPFIDVHSHVFRADLAGMVAEMDSMDLRVVVDLSGGSGDSLAAKLKRYAPFNGRIVAFANVDFSGIDDAGWGARAAAQLERDVRAGAVGLKIYKTLGLDLRGATGQRVRVDDPRLDPVWAKAGALNIPVLIHTGEPAPFFEPVDRHNERWLELNQFPERARPPDRYPTFDQVMAEQRLVFRRHPGTRFINAHLGWMGNDLARLGALLDSIPNMTTELGAVLYELGRQPRAARAFLIRYQDRVMMGKDIFGSPAEFHVYFRVLETEDEYFDYYRRRHAFWKMYGLALPDSVLRKVYRDNALRIVPGIDARLLR